MRRLLIRLSSSALLAATLGVGFAHAASISDTGPRSNNQISNYDRGSFKETNTNNVNVTNTNYQSASSGNAYVVGNTRGGDAKSGNARNDNSTSTSVDISNGSGSGFAMPSSGGNFSSISNTGPGSNNQIRSTEQNVAEVTNSNNIGVSNFNSQSAHTGNAVVAGNTWGGNAISGDASNYNSVNTHIGVSNGGFSNLGHGFVGQPVHASSHEKDGSDSRNFHRNYPTRSNQGLHSDNPCVSAAESHGRRDRDHVRPCDVHRHEVPVVNHEPCERMADRDWHPNPCPVVGHPIVRPPCVPVVRPCKPVVEPCRPVVQPCRPVVRPCPPVVVAPCRPVVKPCPPVIVKPCPPVVRPCPPVKVPCQKVVVPCHVSKCNTPAPKPCQPVRNDCSSRCSHSHC